MASTSPVPVTHKQIREARRRRVKRLRDAWPFDKNTNGGLEMPTPLKDVEPQVAIVNAPYPQQPWMGLLAQRPETDDARTILLRPLNVKGEGCLTLANGYRCVDVEIAAVIGIATLGKDGPLRDPPYRACPDGVQPCELLGCRYAIAEEHQGDGVEEDVQVETLRGAVEEEEEANGGEEHCATAWTTDESEEDGGEEEDEGDENLLPNDDAAPFDVAFSTPPQPPPPSQLWQRNNVPTTPGSHARALRALAATRHGGGGAGRASWGVGCDRGREGRWASSLWLAADALERLDAELRRQAVV